MTQIPDAAVQAAYKACEENSHLPVEERLRRGIAAALPHLQLGFEVKKMEWELLCGFGSKKAKTPFGEYKTDKHHMQLWLPESEPEYPRFSDDPFKEAQDDFERRVRECIVAKPVDDASMQAKVSEIGNQIHNLGCEHQNDEALTDRLRELRDQLWDISKDYTKLVDVAAVQILETLKKAEMFIENGVELGFIRLPDQGDPALETLPLIKEAIRVLSAEPAQG